MIKKNFGFLCNRYVNFQYIDQLDVYGMREEANHLLGQGAWCVMHSTEDLDTW